MTETVNWGKKNDDWWQVIQHLVDTNDKWQEIGDMTGSHIIGDDEADHDGDNIKYNVTAWYCFQRDLLT